MDARVKPGHNEPAATVAGLAAYFAMSDQSLE
jgi:hypothetical protein